MSRRMLFFIICLLLALAEIAGAQVTGPTYTFTALTTISPDEVNTNFTNIYGNALNRFAGVMGGNLTWSVDATYDVGASGGSRMRDLFVGRDVAIVRNETVGGTLGVTGATTLSAALSGTSATFSSTLVVTGAGTFSSTLAVTGNTTVGGTLGVTGATTLSTLGVSSIATFSQASNAVRIGSAGAPSTFNGKIELFNNAGFAPLEFYDSSGSSDQKYWQFVVGSGAFTLRQVNDASSLVFDPFVVTRSGYNAATITLNAAISATSILTPSALALGNNNDYAPTGFSGAYVLRLTANAGGSALTGLAGGTNGRQIRVCNVGSSVTIDTPGESASSTAANRFAAATPPGAGGMNIGPNSCQDFWYDGTLSRWVGIWGQRA